MTRLRNATASRAAAAIAAIGAGLLALSTIAHAAKPVDWQMGLQPSNSSIMDDIHWFHDFTLIIISVIVLLVTGLLGYVMIRFNAKANPTPSKVSHNSTIEIIWTVVPIIVLVMIAVPSFRLLYKQIDLPKADLTIKATGNQWSWSYEYPDYGDLTFDQNMIKDHADLPADERATEDPAEYREKLKPGEPRLLAVDNEVVVPVGKTVVVLVTASDVIHAWAVPSLGTKIDAVPGRINETWFKADRVGLYYGQCSELCGKDHAYMPIAVRVVTDEQFAKWSEAAKSDVEEANKLLSAMIETAGKAVKVAGQ